MYCPLCSSTSTALQGLLSTPEIATRWEEIHGIDVRSEFGGVSNVELHKCHACTLAFFKPDSVAGSSRLYGELQKQKWYYLPRKWEHDAALQDMNGARNGLEIGCGFGAFVARTIEEKRIPFEGCEQNPSAVAVAHSNGLPVRIANLEDMVKVSAATYDVVCAFQVLEHVVEPGSFLRSATALLRPGGKLILGVPNANSAITRMLSIFDAPPHHMSRWSEEVLTRLPKWFPLKIVRVAREPLQDSKVELYVEAQEDFLRRKGLGSLLHPWVRSLTIRLLRNPKLRTLLKGETIYACYVRI